MEIDVLFCPGGLYGGRVPKNCKLVTTFQNMMPFDLKQRVKYPFGYMRFRNWILEKALLKSMINSELVIFISEYAKSFIEKKSNNRINKSVVIPHGVDSIFFKDSLTNLVIPDDFPKDYLLYISTIEFYKAQIEVIEAYAILKRKINELPKLILMGPEYKPYVKLVKKTIVKNKLQNYVFLKEAIPNKDLPALYQNALINIFASMTENCPLILLEAMASGRPLVVSNYPPMPEFGSTAVEYFNPTNPNDLASLLSKVLSNKDISDQMSKKALIRAKDFDWRVTAKKTWIAINSL
jgi:glycosyltransferase involved in cell wall biosynthesis